MFVHRYLENFVSIQFRKIGAFELIEVLNNKYVWKIVTRHQSWKIK